MTQVSSKPRQSALVWALVALGVVLLGLAITWFLTSRSGPQPQFADNSQIHIAENGPIPPAVAGDSGVVVAFSGLTSGSADLVLIDDEQGHRNTVTLSVGESASLSDFTLTLCATWINKNSPAPWDTSVGSNDYADRVYYVYSTDGSTPECPARA